MDPGSLEVMTASLAWAGLCSLVVARRVRPLAHGGVDGGDDALMMLVAATATLFGVVPLAAFGVHVVLGWPVQPPLLAGAATVIAAVCIATMPKGGGSIASQFLPRDAARVALKRRGLVIFAALAVAGLYYLRFGGPLSQFHCIREAAFIAWGSNVNQIDLLSGNVGDARLGNAAVMAAAIGWFHNQRALHAVLGFMLALGGWIVGVRTGQRGRFGWVGLLMLSCNPIVLAIPMVEENVLAVGFSAAVVGLAVSRRPPWLLTGVLFGLVFAMRHPFAVATPGLAYLAWREAKARGLTKVLAGAAMGSAVSHVHHVLAFGSLFSFESNTQFAAQPYNLFGVDVAWRGMANWPLFESLVRTPHNPFPMLVGWPLHIADHLGALLFGAALLGFWTLWRRNRDFAVFWAFWCVPMAAAVALQEAWDHPNKMGVAAIWLPALTAWSVAGVAELTRTHRGRVAAWIAFVALVGATLATASALTSWDVGADQRYFAGYHRVAVESDAWQLQARREATAIALWPDFARVNRYGEMLNSNKLNDFEQYTAWGWFDNEIPPPDTPVTLELDLTRSFWGRATFVKVTSEAPHIDLVGKSGTAVAVIPVRWDRPPLTVSVTRGPRLAHIELAFTDFRRREPGCRWGREPCHCDYFDTYEYGTSENACSALLDHGILKTDKLRVRTTMRAVSVTGLVSDIGHVVHLWKARISGPNAEVTGPFLYWHD